MRKLMTTSALIAATVAMAGCGALFNGGPASVQFTSTPDGADVWIDGSPRGRTPVMLQLSKNQNHTIVFKKDGYGDFGASLNKQVSAGLVILDVLGGLFPVVIDAATGSWYKLSANTVHGSMTQTTSDASGQLSPEQLNLIKMGMKLDSALKVAPAK